MRVVIFSDVHGNLIALERLLKAVQGNADAFLCLGDAVDYGPWNDECLERIHQLPKFTLLEGNHERLFLGLDPVEREPPLVQLFLEHSRPFFTRRDLIMNLPQSAILGNFRCQHSFQGRSIYQDTACQIDRDFFLGHSHVQFRIERTGFTIVNPGSVGQNRKWIDRVDYAVVDTDQNDISLQSIDYNLDAFLDELRARRYPAACISYYEEKPRWNT